MLPGKKKWWCNRCKYFLWLQKASTIHEVLEINTVKWTPEKEVRETWRCALRGHLTEGEAKKLSSTLWVRRMKITSADTSLEEGSVGITHACIKQKCTIIISKSCEPNQPNPLFTQTSCKSTMMAEKRNVPEEVRVEGSLLETHRKDLVHEPVNHYAVLVINTNCLLKYNWPANKAAPRPRLALTLKAGAAWWSGDIHMISSWFFTTF